MAGPKGHGQGDKKRKPSVHSAGGDKKPFAKKQKLDDGKAAARDGTKPKFQAKAGAGAGPGKERNAPKVKLTRHEQKDQAKAKSAALKKNYGLIQDAIVIWEALRPKQTSAAEKAELVTKLMSKVDGRLVELAANHTASRVIQFMAKHGNKEQRAKITEQVKVNMVPLAKSKYGHHVVRKLINVATKAEVPELVRAFRGHIAELLRHPQGCDVVMDLYDVATTGLRNVMCAEFYGREFVLFDGLKGQGSGLTSLSSLLKDETVTKRRSVMQHMTKALVPIMEKGLLHPPIVHRLLRDFLECAPSLSVEDTVDTLSATGAALLKMVHTHDGAAVVCAALGYGTAKDRKRLVKAMKGHVGNMATNEWGYTVLACALSVVDDTSITSKTICNELKAMMSDAIEDNHAARVLLQLLSPNNTRYFPPAVLAMLQLPQRTVKGSSGKMVTDMDVDEDDMAETVVPGGDDDGGDELFAPKDTKKPKAGNGKGKGKAAAPESEDGEGEGQEQGDEGTGGGERILGLSKKEPVLRRREMLASGGKDSFGAALATTCAASAGALLRTPIACDVVVEVARGGDGGVLYEVAPGPVNQVHEAIVLEASGQTTGDKEDGQEPAGPGPQAEHVFTHYYASRALRRLLLASGSEEGGTGPATMFAEKLWTEACAGRCKEWAGGHGAKVLAAFFHCGSQKVKAAAAAELKPLVAPEKVEEWSARLVGERGHGNGKHMGQPDGKQKGQPAARLKAGAAAVCTKSGSQANGQNGQAGQDKGNQHAQGAAAPTAGVKQKQVARELQQADTKAVKKGKR